MLIVDFNSRDFVEALDRDRCRDVVVTSLSHEGWRMRDASQLRYRLVVDDSADGERVYILINSPFKAKLVGKWDDRREARMIFNFEEMQLNYRLGEQCPLIPTQPPSSARVSLSDFASSPSGVSDGSLGELRPRPSRSILLD